MTAQIKFEQVTAECLIMARAIATAEAALSEVFEVAGRILKILVGSQHAVLKVLKRLCRIIDNFQEPGAVRWYVSRRALILLAYQVHHEVELGPEYISGTSH